MMPLENKEIRISQLGSPITGSLPKFGLSAEQIKKIERICKNKALKRGECLLSIGSVPDAVCILKRGNAELLATGINGELRSIRPVAKGELLGVTESLANAPCDVCLRSVTDCDFSLIVRDEFISFLKGEPDICFQFASIIAKTLIEATRAACESES